METVDRSRLLRRLYWIKLVTFLLVVTALILILTLIDTLLLSVVLAVVAAYVVSPVVSYLEGTGMGRLAAIVIV